MNYVDVCESMHGIFGLVAWKEAKNTKNHLHFRKKPSCGLETMPSILNMLALLSKLMVATALQNLI